MHSRILGDAGMAAQPSGLFNSSITAGLDSEPDLGVPACWLVDRGQPPAPARPDTSPVAQSWQACGRVV